MMHQKTSIKVCGMREASNIQALEGLDIDYMGLIFYPASKRFVKQYIPDSPIPKVGVFVNESIDVIQEKIATYQLSYIQLHGDETAHFCRALQDSSCQIIKAFRVDEYFDFEQCKAYESYCNYFLFDAKGKDYGGNGIIFDWGILHQYQGKLPFFLSGGINLQSIVSIQSFKHERLFAIDINSGFEISAGLKDIPAIQQFIQQLSNT